MSDQKVKFGFKVKAQPRKVLVKPEAPVANPQKESISSIEDGKIASRKDGKSNGLSIPMVTGKVEKPGKVPTADDYESVPVEEFGMALLRGMGWKETDKVEPVKSVRRPKGMGLGFTPS
ncbi:uncharacterized protein LOC141856434 [Brevipalpus obovatus]|uniref:uncharacterized protein LOC141856434 n=1 Tax=Brevipalpus obovatus TaxID=246614 RepID=UPI003D9F0234